VRNQVLHPYETGKITLCNKTNYFFLSLKQIGDSSKFAHAEFKFELDSLISPTIFKGKEIDLCINNILV
jgi:hypothetical protein